MRLPVTDAAHFAQMSERQLLAAFNALTRELCRRGLSAHISETSHELALERMTGADLGLLARTLDGLHDLGGLAS